MALGNHAVIPSVNLAHPLGWQPSEVLEVVNRVQATVVQASPALWMALLKEAEKNGTKCPSVRIGLTGGAEVSPSLHAAFSGLSPHGELCVVYAATEGLPLAWIGSKKVLTEQVETDTIRGMGICLGQPCAGVKVQLAFFSPDLKFEKRLGLSR